MASFFGSPASSPFLSHPLTRNPHFTSSSSQTPPPQQPAQPGPQPPPAQQLSASSSAQTTPAVVPPKQASKPISSQPTKKADSTDWIASTLTRRFGLGAGLAWAGFLAFGVISEQVKTRFEVSQQEANTRNVEKEEEVILPNGIRYYEIKVGGGATPRAGDLVVIDVEGKVKESGEVFVETFGKENKALALVIGSRPYSKGICEGIEYVLKSMKAGGRRRVIVPPKLGFREGGADLGSGVQIPPNATLEYILEVDKVSIAPA